MAVKTLYILRHAAAAPSGRDQGDEERPLTKRGHEEARGLGAHLSKGTPPPDWVLCSSALRTRETHASLLENWRHDAELCTEDELYLASAGEMLARLREVPESAQRLLLIAHNPGAHELAYRLCADGESPEQQRLARQYPPAALCCLSFDGAWSDLRQGAGVLSAFLVPADLA